MALPDLLDAPQGFLARIALQDAEGGVNGHRVVPLVINDQSSPTGVATAVQEAMAKGALGVVSDSAFIFFAYKYLQQEGVPVTGAGALTVRSGSSVGEVSAPLSVELPHDLRV